MKVALLGPSPVPYVVGGAQRLWDGLYGWLSEHTDHEVELLKLPSPERTLHEVIDSYRAWSRLDLAHFDLVISTKYPAWMVSHPNHVVYLLHPLRGLYDTYASTGLPTRVDPHPAPVARLASTLHRTRVHADLPELFAAYDDAVAALGIDSPAFAFPGPLARAVVHRLDRVGMSDMRRYAAISRTVARRPGYFPRDARIHVLHPPSNLATHRRRASRGFFTASRLDGPKRIDLIVRAMRLVRGPMPLLVAGTGPEEDRLRALARDDPRIRFLGRVTSEQLAEHYADALAVPFVPADEDLGLITLEAMATGVPVVTASDSGGPTEFVEDGHTGLVCAPDPPALAAALQRLVDDPAAAARMGDQARRRANLVTWAQVADGLLPRPAGAVPLASGRPRMAVLSTFRVHPPRSGGQLRAAHLYGALADKVDVEIISLGHERDIEEEISPRAGMREHIVPKSETHARLAAETDQVVGVRVGVEDVIAARLARTTPEFLHAVRKGVADADVVLLAHPYLAPLARVGARTAPLIYDAHNLEADLKRAILPDTASGREVVAQVDALERLATESAALVCACTDAEADAFRARYAVEEERLLVVPNGVDTQRTRFVGPAERAQRAAAWLRSAQRLPSAPPVRAVALFLGSWHPPNIEAVECILAAAGAQPRLLFLLVGSACEPFRRRRLPANVRALGAVADTTKCALLATAQVALNPMTSGSGSNLKVLEYFAAGIPVVSTRFGVRGIAARPDVHYAEADAEPARFAGAVGAVLDDHVAAAARAQAARALVEQRYDWRVLAKPLAAAVQILLNGRAAPAR